MQVVNRSETKYELRPSSASHLRTIVERRLPCFEFRPGHRYTLNTTVYFDTARFDLFKAAQDSGTDNVKLRLREYSYGTGNALLVLPYCFLEIKQRVRGNVSKRRIQVPKDLINRLLDGDDIWDKLVAESHSESARATTMTQTQADAEKENATRRAIYSEIRSFLATFRVLPRASVGYRRIVFQSESADVRVTFDDDIRIFSPTGALYGTADTLFPHDSRRCRRLKNVIMEVKCLRGVPDWLVELLETYVPSSISKFKESVKTFAS